jgi:hypothetical protein
MLAASAYIHDRFEARAIYFGYIERENGMAGSENEERPLFGAESDL